MTLYILGGGPTGLAIADGLHDRKIKGKLIEKSKTLGGLAQSIAWKGVGKHDLGPHKIFTLNKKLLKRVKSLVGNNKWLTHKKISSIYIKNFYLPYPPSPFSLLKVYGFKIFFKMIVSYFWAILILKFRRTKPDNFEISLSQRVGYQLYKYLFSPIARKLWGNPKNLDSKLADSRVQTPTLKEIIFRLLGIQKKSEFEALTYIYPLGGIQEIWDSIYKKTKENVHFNLNTEVLNINVQNKIITSIETDSEFFEIKENDFVVSTIPLSILSKSLKGDVNNTIINMIDSNIKNNDLYLIFLHIKEDRMLDKSWIFIPDEDVSFHRISEQSAFDDQMISEGSVVMCEIMNSEERNFSYLSNKDLLNLVEKDLKKMKMNFTLLDFKVVKLNNSYPVYEKDYKNNLDKIIQYLDDFKNFKSIGRQGSFNYIGTLDCMDIGYGFVDWFVDKKNRRWNSERERTSYYPVLD